MRQLRRAIAFLLLVWLLPGCSTYRTTDLTPQEAVVGQEAVKVMLAEADANWLTVRQPWVRSDSLGGVTQDDADWSVPLVSVSEVRTKGLDWSYTAAVGFCVLAVPTLVGLVVANNVGG